MFLPLLHPNSTRLTSNADSGHSDQQDTQDDDEEDDKDEGTFSLALDSVRTCSDVGSTVIITCDLRRIIDNVKSISYGREAPIP